MSSQEGDVIQPEAIWIGELVGTPQEQVDQLAAMYDASPIGLAILDTDLRYVRINQHLAALNGIPAAEHIGRSVSEIVPELTEQALAALRRVLGGEVLKGI